ncbi:MAG: signal transduction histidine kinase/ligand-binding sensor domain-containing protein [Phenylobacterium sp.]|jgi:signal transduction histidine kinase/ligand-binding sensor domain-containing protein/DNA-binding response OmpR family regulator
MRLVSLFLLLLTSLVAAASAPTVRFDPLTVKDGLSQISVEATIQDSKGFLWFATHDGLNRYDGYQFKHFRHDPEDITSLSDSDIRVIYEDTKGTLWIGTKSGGLNKFDRKRQRFTRFVSDHNDPNSLSHNQVTAIVEDKQGLLWIGTLGGGLNQYHPATNQFSHLTHQPSKPNSLSSNHIRTMIIDKQGLLWIGTNGGGLNQLDSKTGHFKHFRHQPANPQSLSHDAVYALYQDNQDTLWIGTYGGGLNKYQPQTQSFVSFRHQPANPLSLSNDNIWAIHQSHNGMLWVGTDGGGLNGFNLQAPLGQPSMHHYQHHSSDPNSLSHNAVRSIYQDSRGLLWVGTLAGGVNKVNTKQWHFGHVKHHPADFNSLSHNIVLSIYQDSKDNLWVGTLGGGLNKKQHNSDRFAHFQHQSGDASSLSDNNIWSVLEDSSGTLWVGSQNGLNQYDATTGSFKHFKHDPQDQQSLSHSLNHSLSHNWVRNIFEDSNKTLWIATWGGGLNRFDPKQQSFTHFSHQPGDPHSLSSNFISDIFEDTKGLLWLPTVGGGLNKFDRKSERFSHYRHDKNKPDSLSHNSVTTFYQDSKGSFWVGTFGGGLNKYIAQSDSFKHYREKDGLANDAVYSILEDQHGYLWLSSNKGLSKFNPDTETFKTYDVTDGLQSNEFNGHSGFKNKHGELFFGGINGFNRFYPDTIKDDKQPVKIVFSDFLLFNQTVPIQSGQSQQDQVFSLPGVINELNQLSIGHQQNLISFEFAALDYASPMKNKYQYKLQGLDDNWITADARIRRATYTNLPSGDYTLRVKASNHDGYWNEQGIAINIHVDPPPWLTWWAWLLYGLVVLLLVLAFVHVQRSKIQQERALNLQLKQVDKLKDEFLANTSHELRTPLNGIIGLAESLIDGATGPLSDKTNANLAMVVSSGKRLANLVNDILDFSKLKNRHLALNTQPVGLHSMADVVLTLSQPLLGHKPIKLINAISTDLPPALADESRLEQILHNLVANAIKFTDSGTVTISAAQRDNTLEISVTDTGIGIAENQFTTIFGSFEQIQGSVERLYSGTGLGLSVSKQLVELHGGQISLASTLGKGSSFRFTLPLGQQTALQAPLQTLPQAPLQTGQQTVTRLHSLVNEENVSVPQRTNDGHQFRILLVDDEPVNRQVLFNHLSLQNYQLIGAASGEEALQVIKNDAPFDLVLLDIMMPRLSGYEVCQKLREDYPVNDLPVIFLTAKNQVADLVQSFAAGANDYLSKPVNKHELLTRVETHLRLLDINRNLERKVADRTAKLEQSNKTITALSKISTEISATLDLKTLVNRVYQHIKELMDVDLFSIGLYQPDKQGVEFKVAIEDEQFIPSVFIAMSEKDRPAVWCIEHQQPMIINDLEQDFATYFGDLSIPEPQLGEHRASIIYWPLIIADKVIGVLTVQSQHKNAYNQHQQEMIRTLAATTAIALDNVSAYREVEEKNREILATQQQLVQSEKMASIGTLTAGVAHEINNPTNFAHVSVQSLEVDLLRFQQFLLELAGDDAGERVLDSFSVHFNRLYDHVDTIKNGTKRIQIIVQALSAFTELDISHKEMANIGDCLQSAVNLVPAKTLDTTQIVTDFTSTPPLLCYPAQLNQVFNNLIINACDAIKTQGKITVGCRLLSQSLGNPSLSDQIEVTVKDNGCGMNETVKNKIFEPFFTTKDVGKGTGLGLSMAYGIVQQHNGQLSVESQPGEGTTFRLTLPVNTSQLN